MYVCMYVCMYTYTYIYMAGTAMYFMYSVPIAEVTFAQYQKYEQACSRMCSHVIKT